MTKIFDVSLPRMELAERQLNYVQSFHPRIDNKASVILAVVSGQLAFLVSQLVITDFHRFIVSGICGFYIVLFGIVVWNLYRIADPNLKFEGTSLVFFKTVAAMKEGDFTNEYKSISDDDLLDQILAQVSRNSQIVSAKYDHLKVATNVSMITFLLWAMILGLVTVQ